MPKISSYPTPSDEGAYAIVVDNGVNYKTRLDALFAAALTDSGYGGMYAEDFFERDTTAGAVPYPWLYASLGGGPSTAGEGELNHPGILVLSQNGASTGAAIWMGSATNILIAGEEETDFIFKCISFANVFTTMGFFDTPNSTSVPVDGVYFTISTAGALEGNTRNNSTLTTTGTSYTLIAGEWYHVRIVINSNATRVDFYLYDESGNLLWTDNSTTNIPTGAGRETTHGIRSYKTTVGTVDLIYLDYVSLFFPKALTR